MGDCGGNEAEDEVNCSVGNEPHFCGIKKCPCSGKEEECGDDRKIPPLSEIPAGDYTYNH